MKNKGDELKFFFLILVSSIYIIGCAGVLDAEKFKRPVSGYKAPEMEAKPQTYYCINNPYEGSLWSPHNSRAFLFEDNKARNINDIVTVNIVEVSDASRNAKTKLTRKAGIKSKITKFLGSPLDFGHENLWGKNTGAATARGRTETPFDPEIDTDSQNSFDGAGSTLRKDKILATLSAKVVDVYPNGNMLIVGNREVTLNNEKQYITLSGIIRPDDISNDNVVLSSAIADAKISLSGKGVIADKQNPGFGHRVFDFIWPF